MADWKILGRILAHEAPEKRATVGDYIAAHPDRVTRWTSRKGTPMMTVFYPTAGKKDYPAHRDDLIAEEEI